MVEQRFIRIRIKKENFIYDVYVNLLILIKIVVTDYKVCTFCILIKKKLYFFFIFFTFHILNLYCVDFLTYFFVGFVPTGCFFFLYEVLASVPQRLACLSESIGYLGLDKTALLITFLFSL